MTSGRLAVLLVAVPALGATLLAPLPSATAQAAPVLSLSSVVDPADPQVVPTGSDTEAVDFAVGTTEAASVTVTASGAGLTIANPGQVLTVGSAAGFSVQVSATTPGFHALTVTVSATGATPQSVTLPYVWADGSPAFPSTGSLAGRTYGWQGTDQVTGLESSTRAVEMLSFVSPTLAYVGLPAAGRPRCATAGKGCVAYSYDVASGLVQVGTHVVGRVDGDGLRTDGFVPADNQDGELFAHEALAHPLAVARPRTRLGGTWRYRSRDYPTGITYEQVTFRKDGTCAVAFSVDGGKVQKLAGGYAVGRGGEVTFRSRGTVAQVGTLLLVGSRLGRPAPASLGLWLVLSGPQGRHGDGNLLKPRR
jgi:hypothetical protein